MRIAAALVLLLLGASPALAQGSDETRLAEARALFERGVQAFDARDFESAEQLFSRSLELRPSSSVRFNLAEVRARRGFVISARALLAQVIADPSAPDRVRETATVQRDALGERLARLTIEAPPGVAVRLDGEPISPARLATSIEVDPGAHTLRLGDGPERETRMGEGESRTVRLALPEATEHPAPSRAPIDDPTPTPTPSEDEADDGWVIPLAVVLSLVAVGAGVGIALGVALSDDGEQPFAIVPALRF